MKDRKSGVEPAQRYAAGGGPYHDEAQNDASVPKLVSFAPMPRNSTNSALRPPPQEAMSVYDGSAYADRLISGQRVSPRVQQRRMWRAVLGALVVLGFAVGFAAAFVHRFFVK